MEVPWKGSGGISLAGLVCARLGWHTRLIHRMLVHHCGRRGEKKGFRERDFAASLDAAHQQLGGKTVLVWDNSTQHIDAQMRQLLAGRKAWLTVFRLPAYAPELNGSSKWSGARVHDSRRRECWRGSVSARRLPGAAPGVQVAEMA